MEDQQVSVDEDSPSVLPPSATFSLLLLADKSPVCSSLSVPEITFHRLSSARPWFTSA